MQSLLLLQSTHGNVNHSCVDTNPWLCCCWCRYKKLWDQDKDAYIRRYEKAQKPLSSYEADVSEYMNKEVSQRC